MEADLSQLESSLGHRFSQRDFLIRALTHRSRANEPTFLQTTQQHAEPGDNERLEYLGDAVLGLVVAEALYQSHPEWREGELTRVRAQLVSRRHMADVAIAIDLGSHLRLSRGEERGGLRNKSTVLSNSMEAVLGAMFLDGGLDPVRTFAQKCIMGAAADQLAAELQSGAALGNYKSALQEYLQSTHSGTPVYRVKAESGPDHRKVFLVEARQKVDESTPTLVLACGKGNTKKLAEQDAARLAMERLTAVAIKLRQDPGEVNQEEPAAQ